MKCKQGDMAVVISSQADNFGRVVTCLKFYGKGPMFYEIEGKPVMLDALHWWVVDRPMNLLQGGKILRRDIVCLAADECLMPISGYGEKIKSKETEEEPA